MGKKKKYYVVWQGHTPGIYDNWADCQQQVKNYPDAKYKSFSSLEEAEDAYVGGFSPGKNKKPITARKATLIEEDIEWESLSVDAACSGNPGLMEYRGVDTKTGTEYFRIGPFKEGTNNIGEFLALVHALALLKKEGKDNLPIYSDSRIAMKWVANGKARTQVKPSKNNQKLLELIKRAEKWLANNTYQNPILKWETKEWGEIPADFGRK